MKTSTRKYDGVMIRIGACGTKFYILGQASAPPPPMSPERSVAGPRVNLAATEHLGLARGIKIKMGDQMDCPFGNFWPHHLS